MTQGHNNLSYKRNTFVESCSPRGLYPSCISRLFYVTGTKKSLQRMAYTCPPSLIAPLSSVLQMYFRNWVLTDFICVKIIIIIIIFK